MTLTLLRPYRPDPREQPRCVNCHHRRVHHFKATGYDKTTKDLAEITTLCGVDVHGYPCGCAEYRQRTRRS